MQFALLSALSLAGAAAAQVSIQVGSTQGSNGGIFQFIPPSVNATNGTVITFKFGGIPGNHSVTQSTFANPCQPEAGGFDSGWVQILDPETEIPEWNLTITDDAKPLWFYCKQLTPTPHCLSGMVGAINAPATGNTFDNFRTAAMNSGGTPGQGVGFLVGIGASASAPVGDIPTGVSTFGAPTPGADTALPSASATGSGSAVASASGSAAASGSATGSAASTSTSSAASHVAGSSIFTLIAAVLGLAMA